MVKAVIFDCFGVIVGQGFEHTYRLAGGDASKDRPFIEDMLGQANLGVISEADFHARVATQIGISLDEWRQAAAKAEQPDTELLTYIASVREQCKTAILSNANRGVVAARIGADWLERCFDEVVVSAEVNMVKPDQRIYLYTAHQLGVAPEDCVFFDDLEYLVEPARQLGMQAFVYSGLQRAKADLDPLLA